MRLFFLFLLTAISSQAQIQCTIDITINEGGSITLCENGTGTISGANGFTAYNWAGPESVTGQTITPQFSGQYILSATDATNCVSQDTIQVTLTPAPIPVLVSSEGSVICPATGTTLSTSLPFATYDWGNGNTNPTLFVNQTGMYTVNVTDATGCVGSESIMINTFNFGVTSSAVSGCSGTNIALTATGGTSYAWSTGEFGNTIIVNPSTTTNYSVQITAGSCTDNLTITVDPLEIEPFAMPDTIYVGVQETHFIAGPVGFNSYLWSPGNQLDTPTNSGVNFTGDSTQMITLEAIHSSGCTLTDSVLVIVVDLSIPSGFSPNSDGVNDLFVIPEITSENYTAKLMVWNRWGEIVLEEDDYQNDWAGDCRGKTCMGDGDLPEGTYFYHVDVYGVTVKGYTTIKR